MKFKVSGTVENYGSINGNALIYWGSVRLCFLPLSSSLLPPHLPFDFSFACCFSIVYVNVNAFSKFWLQRLLSLVSNLTLHFSISSKL